MDCLFCKIAQGEIPSTKIYEDERFFAFKDIAPQAPVHFLVIPKQHIESLDKVTEEDVKLLGDAMLFIARLARKFQGYLMALIQRGVIDRLRGASR